MIFRSLLVWPLIFCTCFATAEETPKRKSIVITRDTVQQQQEAATLPLGDVSYEEVEPIIRQMLGPKGTIGYFARRKAIIIYDTPAKIVAVKGFLASVDRPSANVRLDVSFTGVETQSDDHLDIRLGNGRRPPIVIEDGEVSLPNRIGIDLGSSRQRTERNAVQTLVARSGSPATIWSGKRVPDPAWLRTQQFTPIVIIPGYGSTIVLSGSEIPWRDVGSSLSARPTLRDDGLVDVELIPVVSYMEKTGKRRNLMVQEVSTKITIAPGHTMQIGGINDATARTLQQLGAHSLLGKVKNAHTLSIQLKATVIQPRQPPRR